MLFSISFSAQYAAHFYASQLYIMLTILQIMVKIDEKPLPDYHSMHLLNH